MKRVLILGNSHLAALRGAAPQPRDLHIDWLGLHDSRLSEVAILDGELVPQSDAARDGFKRFGGFETARMADYDAIVLCGFEMSVFRAVRSYREGLYIGLPSVPDFAAAQKAGRPLISKALFQAWLKDRLKDTLGLRFLPGLRAAYSERIIVIPQPHPSLDGLSGGDSLNGFRVVTKRGDAGVIADHFDQAMVELGRELGFETLVQPAKTRAHAVLSGPEYMRGALRLSKNGEQQQDAGDFIHANPTYGALILDGLAGLLAAAP